MRSNAILFHGLYTMFFNCITTFYSLGFYILLFSLILLVVWQSVRGMKRSGSLSSALADERQIFAALVENSSDFIGIADPDGKPVYLNPAGRRMVGLPPTFPIEDTKIPEYYPPDVRAFASDVIVKSMSETGAWKGETYFRRWDSEEAIPVSDEHFIIKDGKSGRILGMGTITRDITEIRKAKEDLIKLNENLELRVAERTAALEEDVARRIQAESELREEKKIIREVLESVKDHAIFRIDADGIIRSWNSGATKITGYQRGEILGKNFAIFYPKSDTEAGKPKDDLRTATGEGKIEEEVQRIRKDGSEFWASAGISSIRDETGQLVGFTVIIRDITDQTLAAKTLKQANELLQSEVLKKTAEVETFKILGESIPQLCWIAHADGRIFWYNQRWYQYTGTTFKEMEGWGWKCVHDPQMLPKVLERWQTSIQTGTPFEMEFTLRGADGKFRWFLTRVSPLRSETGEVISWFGTNTDIDAQKQASLERENHLQAINSLNEELEKRVEERTVELELQATIVANMAEGVCLVGAEDGKIIYSNPKFDLMFGYNAGELIGKSVRILNYEEDAGVAERVTQLMNLIRARGIHSYEIENIRKDGKRLWRRVNASTFQHPRYGLVFVAVHEDITERKLAENALKDSEERFRRVFESAHDGIIIVDEKGYIQQANDRSLKMFGYTHEEIIGSNLEILIPENLREKHRVNRQSYIANPDPRPMGVGLELYGRRKDGAQVPVDISLSPIQSSEGLRVTAIIRDITERREYAQALRERAKELARSNAELEQFAYVASHDLREPLRAISNYTQLLERRYKGSLDEAADKYIRHLVEGVSRMQNLISDLLAYSKVRTITSEANDLDMDFIVKEALQSLKIAVAESKAEVYVESLPIIKADPVLMLQLMQNLISNALKFRRPEVTPEIRISARKEDNAWIFAVRDNGIGIEQRHWDRVFVIFQRLHTRDQYSGTGIGLAICKKIVEQEGGMIWLESVPGQGTTFFFELPVR